MCSCLVAVATTTCCCVFVKWRLTSFGPEEGGLGPNLLRSRDNLHQGGFGTASRLTVSHQPPIAKLEHELHARIFDRRA